MTHRAGLPLIAGLLVAFLIAARPTFAGPPLLCHPFDIGSARSLPWDGATWLDGNADYKVDHLVVDTEALLGPSTPVIVRMETLRRASIYAGRDARVAAELLSRLTAAAHTPAAHARGNALALLDAAYVTEALREITIIGGVKGHTNQLDAIRALVRGIDSGAFMRASLAAQPDDPSLEFAAALIVASTDKAAYARHAERARAGAGSDPLLARNLSHIS